MGFDAGWKSFDIMMVVVFALIYALCKYTEKKVLDKTQKMTILYSKFLYIFPAKFLI